MTDTVESGEKPVLTFNDQNYVMEDLSDRAKYIVGQLQDLGTQAQQARARLDQIEVATKGFTELLGEELEPSEESSDPVEGELVN